MCTDQPEQLWTAADQDRRSNPACSSERPRAVESGGRSRHETRGERAQVSKAVPIDIELLVGDITVTIHVEGWERSRDVRAVVDQVLRESIPATELVAVVVVDHAAELQLDRPCVEVEGRLQDRLPRRAVSVVASRVFHLGVEPIAEAFAREPAGPAQLHRDHAPVPGSQVDAQGSRPGCNELAAFLDTRRLRVEVQVAAHLSGTVDRRRRTAHDVHSARRGDGRGVVARIL